MESQESFKKIRISKVIKKVKDSLERKYSHYGVSFNIINRIPNNFEYNTNEVIMETIFTNLIDNSIKYRVPGTTPEIIINYKEVIEDNLLYLHVQDNGIGFTEQEINKGLFSVFFNIFSHGCFFSGYFCYIFPVAMDERTEKQIN